ncbi:MAG TPA: hypothetical protein PKW18_13920 [Candidatus Sumerlaeota bacterium]|nr:hypothetical protein [Candidatus Sumerlaeota bacterium]
MFSGAYFVYQAVKDAFSGGGGDDDSGSDQTKSDPNQAYIDALMGLGGAAAVDYNAMYEAMANMYAKMSAMNEEKFKKYWPESITQGIAAGQAFDAAGREQAVASTVANLGLADISNAWLANMTSYGNIYMRSEAGKMNQWMMGQVADVNAFNSEQFYQAMDAAMPGIRDTAAAYKETVDQMLTGELPDAVKSEIAQAAAERGLSSGIYGPAYDNAQLRDLGIERLQYLQAGQAQVPALTGVMQALTAPVATPNIYQNVMMTPTPYTPQPTYTTPSNVAGISQNYLAAITGQTMMQPAAGMQAVGNMAQIQSQTNIANTQLQYAQAMSMLNYGVQQQNLAWNQSMFNQQMQQAQEQRYWDLAGTLIGAGAQLGGASMMSGGGGRAGGGSMFGSWY